MTIRVFAGADEQIVALFPTGLVRLLSIEGIADLIADEPTEPDVYPCAVYVRDGEELVEVEFTTDEIAGTVACTVKDGTRTVAHATARIA